MDDKGLQNPKPTTNPPPAVSDDSVNKPATQAPASTTPLPPPSIPSMPPSAAGVTPPPAPPASDDKPIPTEEPKTKKPKRRLGKNAKKIVGGVLMLALLVGGVVVGRNVVEERQVVESEAARPDTAAECYGCTGVKNQYWKWVKVNGVWQCKKRKDKDKCDLPNLTQNCGTLSGAGCADKKVGDSCGTNRVCIHSPGYLDDAVTNAELPCSCQTQGGPTDPSPTPIPTPTSTPTPSATPSPGPGISCVGLRSDTSPVEYGDTVTFSCEGNFSSASNPYAQFSGSVNGVEIYASSNVPIDPITNTATYDMEINEWGDWEVQCRVCADGVGCTEWGEAN